MESCQARGHCDPFRPSRNGQKGPLYGSIRLYGSIELHRATIRILFTALYGSRELHRATIRILFTAEALSARGEGQRISIVVQESDSLLPLPQFAKPCLVSKVIFNSFFVLRTSSWKQTFAKCLTLGVIMNGSKQASF